MFKIARDKEKWAYIRNAEEYAHLRDMLFSEYDEYCKDQPIPQLTFEDEMLFFKTGSRVDYESKYFKRRRQLTIYALMYLFYPEKEEYLAELQNVICEICNEWSWAVPAHKPCDDINKREHIDLFAAETGFYLAEIKYILIDKLDSLVIDRITREIKWRIIDSFKKERFVFEDFKSNWATVCGGSVGATLLYEDLQSYMQEKPRIEKCMQHYLESLTEDGGCSEGPGYWNYGFGFYVLYNELLRNHTRGRLNYFDNEKVRKTAGFLSTAFVDNRNVAAFADSSLEIKYSMALAFFVNREFGVNLPPLEGANFDTSRFSWTIRSFLWYDPTAKSENKNTKAYYDKLGVYVERYENCGFAIKGGHNDEEHNHNDVGSFILTHNSNVIFAELGAPEYRGDTFQNRHKILNSSSLGHSVPIIDGEQQLSGREYCGDMTVDETDITIDMTKAYPMQDKKIVRHCNFNEKEFMLTDEFEENIKITERFILLSKPDISKKGIFKVCDVSVSYSNNFDVKCTEVDNTMRDGKTHRTVYILDFEPIGKANKFELKVDLK